MEDAYAAGIVDADGSIIIGRQTAHIDKRSDTQIEVSYHLKVQVSMRIPSQVPMLIHLQYGGKYGEYKNNQGNSTIGTQDCVMARWTIHGTEAQDFLTGIRPYMIEKAAQADVAMVFPVAPGGGRIPAEKEVQEHCFNLIKTLRSGGKGRGQGRR